MLRPVRDKPCFKRPTHDVGGSIGVSDGSFSASVLTDSSLGGGVAGVASKAIASGAIASGATASWATVSVGGFFFRKNLNMVKKYIRIVAGQYRRTPIEVPDLIGLRPTPDRVRETLFNWLTHFWQGDFSDKQVLDLFAGSGALGFEAASRGVEHVQMVEADPVAIAALRKWRDRLKANAVRIQSGSARSALDGMENSRYDLIFLDPPFGKGWFPDLLKNIEPLLKPSGLVYVESEQSVAAPNNYAALRQARAGAVHYQLLQRIAPPK